MLEDGTQDKPIIEYPCEWTYKVIGAQREALESAVGEVMGSQAYDLSFSNWSKGGAYCSLNLKVTVETEDNRTEIYHSLQRRSEIRYVL